jgi:hypothetical protein
MAVLIQRILLATERDRLNRQFPQEQVAILFDGIKFMPLPKPRCRPSRHLAVIWRVIGRMNNPETV